MTTQGSTIPFTAIGFAFGGMKRANDFAVHSVSSSATAPAQMERTSPSSTICRISCARARAQTLANGDLAPPRHKPHQRQRGHVGARQQQHHPRNGQQNRERSAIYPFAPNGDRHIGSSVIGVRAQVIVRIRRHNPPHDGLKILVCLLAAHARPQPSHHVQPIRRCARVIRQPPVPSGSSVTHISCRSPGIAPMKPFGATPITVTWWRAISSGLPTIPGSPA